MNVGCCDSLDPVQLGETMGMPLSPELLQKAASAGITRGTSQYANNPLSSGGPVVNLGTPLAASAAPTYTQTSNLNVNGNLSLILQDKASSNYLNLVLRQNDGTILGHGNIISGNSFQNVTANGKVENGKLSLTIEPYGGSEIYKLELQSDENTLTGSYNIQYANGATHSGMALGILPNNSIKMQPSSNQPQQNPVKAVSPTSPLSSSPVRTLPIPIGHGTSIGSTFGSSKSISMGTNSGGSMVSSTSSTTF